MRTERLLRLVQLPTRGCVVRKVEFVWPGPEGDGQVSMCMHNYNNNISVYVCMYVCECAYI